MTKKAGKRTTKPPQVAESRSVRIARDGITNSQQFTSLFSGLIADLAEQKVTAGIANAMCNAGGKMLKMVELEIRYGQQVPGKSRRMLTISGTYESEAEAPTAVLPTKAATG
jgi:hypothetical protein